jgi:DNA polymerase I
LCKQLLREPMVAVDTETTGLDIVNDEVVLWSLSDGKHRWCIPRDMLPVFEPLLTDPQIIKIATNAKFDLHMLANSGLVMEGPIWDTVVMDWLLDENRIGRHGLKQCVTDYNILPNMPDFQETFGPYYQAEYGKKRIPKKGNEVAKALLAAPQDVQTEYASLDAWASFRLAELLKDKLAQVKYEKGFSAWDHFIEVEVPFTRVLWDMERAGICVSGGYLDDIKEPMDDALATMLADFVAEAGRPINPRSVIQLREVFFEKEEDENGDTIWTDPFGDAPRKMTKGGTSGNPMPSLDKEVLADWAGRGNELAKILRAYRDMSKIHGTYVVGLSGWLDDYSRIHSTFNQTGTVTGRLSSRDPNLQNIPRPGKDPFFIRGAFTVYPGKILLVLDYQQLEMRLMAHYSGDEAMVEAILDGKDLHSFTVSQMGMGATYDDVVAAKKAANPTKWQEELLELRQAAKAVGFGLIYGIGEVLLGKNLGLPILDRYDKGRYRQTCPKAAELTRAYFKVFPGVKAFIKDTKSYAHRTGYVQTLAGRMRRLPDINSRNRMLSSQAERQAVNSVIQGSAGDIAKVAMIMAAKNERLAELGVKMLLQIHDELVFELPDRSDVREEALEIIKDIMENPFDEPLDVPLPVDGDFGYTWGDAK